MKTNDTPFFHIAPTAGTGNGELEISAGPYDGRIAREGSFDVAGLSLSDSAQVVQDGAGETVAFDSDIHPVAKSGGVVTITGRTNAATLTFDVRGVDWTPALPPAYTADGQTVQNGQPIPHDPGSVRTFPFSIDISVGANPRVSQRGCRLIVTTGGGLSAVATILQSAADLPKSFPPNGPAGGDLSGEYPNPSVEHAKQAGNADTVDGKHAVDFIPANARGAAGGVADLDATGKVPAAKLPAVTDAPATFTQAASRDNISSGENLGVIFGKIKKWFADMKTVAFSGAYSDLSGTPSSLPASGGHADTSTGDADGKDIRTTYLPRRDKQTFDADVNTLWAIGSSVVLSHVNTPRTDTYYLVSTFGTNGSDCSQIAVPRSGGPAYYRGFNANNNTWSAWEQIRRINDKVTTSDIADAAITAPKLSSDLTLPGTPQVGTPGALNSPSQTIATIGNVNAAVDAVQIGGTNIYRDTLGTSDFYLSATGEMKYRRFLDLTPEAKRNLQGQNLTVSFDYILENAVFGRAENGFAFNVRYADGTTMYVMAFLPAETSPVTRSGRFSYTVKIEDKEIADIISFQPFMYARTTSGTATVGRPKFEIGTKATQWSPAPEEMARKKDLDTLVPTSGDSRIDGVLTVKNIVIE